MRFAFLALFFFAPLAFAGEAFHELPKIFKQIPKTMGEYVVEVIHSPSATDSSGSVPYTEFERITLNFKNLFNDEDVATVSFYNDNEDSLKIEFEEGVWKIEQTDWIRDLPFPMRKGRPAFTPHKSKKILELKLDPFTGKYVTATIKTQEKFLRRLNVWITRSRFRCKALLTKEQA